MLRVVLAVALAVALLGTAMPALEDARDATARATVTAQLERLDRAATQLVERNDLPPPGVSGPRRVLSLSLPARTWGNSGLTWLRFPPENANSLPRWQVGSTASRVWRPSVSIAGPPRGLVIRGGGQIRLVLRLQRGDEGSSVIISRRDFITHRGTSPAHADTSGSDLRTPL